MLLEIVLLDSFYRRSCDYVDEIVAAYDKVLSELDDGFNAVKKKNSQCPMDPMVAWETKEGEE